MEHIRIAIDGPAGAGKSTVARELARRLGILYIDTGAMYRGVAWLAQQHGVLPSDEARIVKLMEQHPLQFRQTPEGTLGVFVRDRNITPELRSPEISDVVSKLSVHPRVRKVLTDWQRAFSQGQSVVMDGRDIGTVVLPDADVKVFLTADLAERAKRRANELRDKGVVIAHERLQAELQERDARDAGRAAAPLRRADDAHCIDSTGKSVDQVVEEIMAIVKRVVR